MTVLTKLKWFLLMGTDRYKLLINIKYTQTLYELNFGPCY